MYSRHMNGESLSVHFTMRRTPPNSTMPIQMATHEPEQECLVEARDRVELRIGLAHLEDGDASRRPRPRRRSRRGICRGAAGRRAAAPRARSTWRRRSPCRPRARSRYFTASVTSANLVLMPRKPASIIQNAAPGPPSVTATATPPMAAESHGAGHRGATAPGTAWLRRDASRLE